MALRELRQSMLLVHTWTGVVTASVLIVVFWMGSLSVFDREIDRWMMPDTRIAAAPGPVSVERQILPAVAALAHGKALAEWSVFLQGPRSPVARLQVEALDGEELSRHVDPRSATLLPVAGSYGATSFFFPMHYRLHLSFAGIGYWVVGLASMAMLAALVSGVIIHARIFKDFFVFRPRKALQRSALDLHNVSGVLALPFHFMIVLSGLVILFSIYFPAGMHALYPGDRQGFLNEALSLYERERSPEPGAVAMAPIDAMLDTARRAWGEGEPSYVRVRHPGNRNSYVEVSRATADRVSLDEQTMYFDGASGRVLKYVPLKPAAALQRYLSGMHFALFEHWPLRWLYCAAGLAGCVMLASGLILWSGKRAARHAKAGQRGARLVLAVACFSTTGLLAATLVMLVANRLLPAAMPDKALCEVLLFLLAWLASGIWAGIALFRRRRPDAPWLPQACCIAVLAFAAPPLNWLGTGDFPWHAVSRGQPAVAVFDLALWLTAALAAWAALRLRQHQRHARRREVSHA
ncbi:PepSY-associated TM helix domain-containing protein [Janthinobacterium sp. 1_2014MBL_MicDiv]|uniref:PepSY-associated TM helix domain-containing protein n=1 Tax=Janthinobacterium sp. 1_2014MBL_MicDiv TaxID=1644131 RepID=UPI0008F5FCF3|nr:PepSY-associated TM helix domain-containing protein [Janthinobacterium sp. 1_2014MBL_MicDiv]APA68034.1 hypothetical protein YQ44_09500 [Janthinobacterium sp. 1_2014MBL_MicDiv]